VQAEAIRAEPPSLPGNGPYRVMAIDPPWLCPAPRYADLFSRYRHNDKWDCHGDEAPHAEAAE
jgi:hypothetical protein